MIRTGETQRGGVKSKVKEQVQRSGRERNVQREGARENFESQQECCPRWGTLIDLPSFKSTYRKALSLLLRPFMHRLVLILFAKYCNPTVQFHHHREVLQMGDYRCCRSWRFVASLCLFNAVPKSGDIYSSSGTEHSSTLWSIETHAVIACSFLQVELNKSKTHWRGFEVDLFIHISWTWNYEIISDN